MLFPTLNKKINVKELFENIKVLDSDEGIRIENSCGKKIFINRNLLGTYCILVRTKKKVGEELKCTEYEEQFFYHNEIDHVLVLIKKNMDKFDIWIY